MGRAHRRLGGGALGTGAGLVGAGVGGAAGVRRAGGFPAMSTRTNGGAGSPFFGGGGGTYGSGRSLRFSSFSLGLSADASLDSEAGVRTRRATTPVARLAIGMPRLTRRRSGVTHTDGRPGRARAYPASMSTSTLLLTLVITPAVTTTIAYLVTYALKLWIP